MKTLISNFRLGRLVFPGNPNRISAQLPSPSFFRKEGSPAASLRWGRRAARLAALVALLVMSLAQPTLPTRAAPQSVINVTTTADEYNTGPACSLREAITAANTNASFGGCLAGSPGADTIILPAGTYTLSIANPRGVNEDINASGDLDILQSLTIQGAGPASTIIQAGTTNTNGIDKVIAANPLCTAGVSVAISGVTVRYGRNSQPYNAPDFSYTGAGIDYCANGTGETFTLDNVVVSDNTNLHGYGGGLNLDSLPGSFTATISNVYFQNNSTANDSTTNQGTGAGINIFGDNPTVNIINSTFSSNQALRTNSGGGAIAFRPSSAATLTISGSAFSLNSAQGSGGAILINGLAAGNLITIQNSQFNANGATASFGGGLYVSNLPANTTPFQLTNLLISGNHAGLAGGGVYAAAGDVILANSRLVNNIAPSGSGVDKNVDTGTLTATRNWWACSGGPSAAPCDLAATVGGTLNFNPRLRDRLTFATASMVTNQTSLLTASLLSDSNTDSVLLANLSQLIGLPVTWSASAGSLSGQQTSMQASGTATASFTATGPGSPLIAAKVDNDATSAGGSNVLTLTVAKADTTATVNSITPNSLLPGQTVTIGASVAGAFGNSPTAPTGTITVSAGSTTCTITLPATSCALVLPNAGTTVLISATYNGDDNFNASPASAGITQTFNKLIYLPEIIR